MQGLGQRLGVGHPLGGAGWVFGLFVSCCSQFASTVQHEVIFSPL